jgi:hypothetical protein
VKETTGEIALPTPAPAVAPPAVAREPSIMVADLAAAHVAITSAFASVDRTPPGDSATPSRELAVAEVRKDAVAFSEAEEAFFRHTDTHPPTPAQAINPEKFEDLDEGYEPQKFWDRVWGRKRPPTEK